MTEENYTDAEGADGGKSSRLLLIAAAMIVAGIGLWSADDRVDGSQSTIAQHLILAGQSR